MATSPSSCWVRDDRLSPLRSPATPQTRLPSRLPGPVWPVMLRWIGLRSTTRPSRLRWIAPISKVRTLQLPAWAALPAADAGVLPSDIEPLLEPWTAVLTGEVTFWGTFSLDPVDFFVDRVRTTLSS